MSVYAAPFKDMRFVIEELAGLEQVVALPGCADATPDTVAAVLHPRASMPIMCSRAHRACATPSSTAPPA
jgi:Acyl-CoA dehydrogenase N terminal